MPIRPKRSQKSWPSSPKNRAPLSENQALSYSLRLFKTRPRTCFEVATRLKERGLPGFQIDSVLQQLTELRLLDDARFARDWVRWRDRTHPSGKRLLQYELTEKGVAVDLVAAVLEERESAEWREDIGIGEGDESVDTVLAAQLIERRSRQWVGLTPEKRQRRVLDLLTRRGFSYGIAQKLAYAALKKNDPPQQR